MVCSGHGSRGGAASAVGVGVIVSGVCSMCSVRAMRGCAGVSGCRRGGLDFAGERVLGLFCGGCGGFLAC